MGTIRIEASACLWWAFLLLVLPLRWVLGAFTAAAFHEFCHYLAIRASGGEVKGILIRPAGTVMQTTDLSSGRELVCALAGPLGGLLLLLFARWIPWAALCALVQSSFNLLPIYPLDGGRALQCAVRLLRPHGHPEKICGRAGGICILLLIVLGVLTAWRLSLGFGALLPVGVLLLRFFPGKRPCKTAGLALQ